MYQTARKLHLWVGLILAIVILAEAVTGLILAEPWLVGQDKGSSKRPAVEQQQTQRDDSRQMGLREGAKPAVNSAFGFVKGLHQGKVGGLDLKWLVDISAIGLVILTVTGVYIAIPILRARHRKR